MLLALALLVLADSARPIGHEKVEQSIDIWTECLNRGSSRFARSVASPGTVADAVFGLCSSEEHAVYLAILRVKTSGGAPLFQAPAAQSAIEYIREGARRRLLARILAIRGP